MKDSVSGAYIDLSGRTGRGHIRSSSAAATTLDTFAVTVMDQVAVPGGVTIALTPAQTAALPLEGGVYDIEIANVGRTWVRTPLAGSVIVLSEVTR